MKKGKVWQRVSSETELPGTGGETQHRKGMAFTILELILVVIVIGIIAAFAIPSMDKALEKSRYRRMRLNLLTIHSALEIYKARNGTYPPTSALTLAQLNSLLNLSITNGDIGICTYDPLGGSPPFTAYSVVAQSHLGGYTLYLSQGPFNDTNPSCSGACP